MGNLFQKQKSRETLSDLCGKDDDDNEEFLEIFLEDVQTQTQLVSHVQKGGFCNDESMAEKLSRIDNECYLLLEKWKKEQLLLKSNLKLDERVGFMNSLKYIGGVDISFPPDKNDLIHACACLVVMSFPDMQIVYKDCQIVHLTSLYIPEFLAFREVEPLKCLCERLKTNQPEIYPQLILVDGNGMLHPRKFGLACHLGVILDIATVGVAKKLFQVDGLEKNVDFKNGIKEKLTEKGDTFVLRGASGFIYGKALRSTVKSSNPIFVSIGNMINLETAITVVEKCCLYRVPEPVRHADILSREFIRATYFSHLHKCQDQFASLNKRFQSLSDKIQHINSV